MTGPKQKAGCVQGDVTWNKSHKTKGPHERMIRCCVS